MTRPRNNRSQLNSPLVFGLLVAFLLSAAITAYLTYAAVRDAVSAWDVTQLQGAPILNGENPQGTPAPGVVNATLDPNVPLQAPDMPTPQPWDGASRVTVLVMGYDYGDWSDERKCPCRTDTMILLTLDPLTQSAGMLSIPRDLWVSIPGFADNYKINQAYYLGDASQLPGGGPGLAIKTVEQFLGVPINFYATVDFTSFERLVDEIGGVEIDVPEEIKVDPLGRNPDGTSNTVILQPGKQTLSGPVALAYARARYTEGGDFDRANRTQQVILAIRDRILSLDMLTTLISKAPVLYQEISAGVKTNLSLDQIIRLAWTASQIPLDSIKKGVIAPPDMVTLGKSPDGLDILIPGPERILELRDQIFTASGPVSPAVAADTDPATLFAEEAARITVLNASYQSGLAATTQEWLNTQGFNVTQVGNADQLSAVTKIYDYTGKPYTIKYIIQVMGLPDNVAIYSSYDPNSEVDVAIILGDDWANSNPMP
jgi:LCP family protein required for cell wall assembly